MKMNWMPRLVSLLLAGGLLMNSMASAEAAREDTVRLSDQAVAMFHASYDSLKNRIEATGYAPTSLTGAYRGMFVRDSAIQIMAHTACGDREPSRRMLQYLLGYHAALGAQRTAHIVPNYQNAEFNNSSPVSEPTEELLTIGGGVKAVQQIPSLNQTVTAVKVLVGRKDNASGQLTATLYKGDGDEGKKVSACIVDIDSLTPEGDWVTLAFTLPLFQVPASEDYYLELSAPESPENSVVWYGTSQSDRYATKRWGAVEETVAGEAGFIALKSEIAFLSSIDQVDTNYMLIHAWAQYAATAGNT